MSGANSISILQTGFIICLAFAIVFFIISFVLFFVFNIRLIFNIRTGRAKKKTIEEMQKANSETGRLRANGRTLTSKLGGKNSPPASQFSAFEKNDVSFYDGSEATGSLEDITQQTSYSVSAPSYKASDEYKSEFAETSLLNESGNIAETSLLNEGDDIAETTLLSGQQGDEFKILQKMVFIHTDEVIC